MVIKALLMVMIFTGSSALACRTPMNHKYLNEKESFAQASVVVSGTLKLQKPSGVSNFTYHYQFKTIDVVWKGKPTDGTVAFDVEHHTCAKYRSPFQSDSQAIAYFATRGSGWELLRIVPKADSSLATGKSELETEVKFLSDQTVTAKPVEPTKLQEGALKLKAEWKVCQASADCVGINYGCGERISVNSKFKAVATAYAYKNGGDPRAMNCVSESVNAQQGPIEYQCREKRCDAFQYPICKSKDCKEKFPVCTFTSKFFIDPTKNNYGASEGLIWGPSEASCREKCEEKIARLRANITHPKDGEYQIECRFEKRLVKKESVKGAAYGTGF